MTEVARDLPLIDLFWSLRDAGLLLGIDQYNLAVEALLQSIEAGLDISDSEAVGRLYRTLWVKSRREQQIFDRAWEEMQARQAAILAPLLDEDVPEPQEEESPLEQVVEPENAVSEPIASELPSIPESAPRMASNVTDVVSAIASMPIKEHYFPISRDRMAQSWQHLTQKLPNSTPNQIDLQATVAAVARQGFFLKPVLTPTQNRHREVVLLVDWGGSMVPFHPLCRQLLEHWSGAKVYYFHNSPTSTLYRDCALFEGESLQSAISRWSETQTVVIILSDAGAARRRITRERWEETVDFLHFLTPRVQKVAWLNPLPRDRWCDTTAEDIAQIDPAVPMFALNPAECSQMLQWVRFGKFSLPKIRAQDSPQSINIWEYDLNPSGQIAIFRDQFGKDRLNFASHAAFPLALTPDLLYSLGQQFFHLTPSQNQRTAKPPLPWYAIADFLLSDLCREVDTELFEMEREVRNELLKHCQQAFGSNRLQHLAQFLLSYIQQQLHPHSLSSDLQQVQQWTALAYAEKNSRAARSLAEALWHAYLHNNKPELVRLSELIETLAEPLAEQYEPLLMVARGYGALARGDERGTEAVKARLEQLVGVGEPVEVAGVSLAFPGASPTLEMPLQEFSFETVTVNRRGEIIKRETLTAKYFREQLSPSPTFPTQGQDERSLREAGEIEEDVTLEMVAIPSGKFLMGSPEGEGYNNEKPQHEVTVQPFFMGKYPITQAQWTAIASRRDLKVERDIDPDPSRFAGNNRPVNRVSWFAAVEFCARLSKLSGREYRLPSEAEWEYACRAVISQQSTVISELSGKPNYPPFSYGDTLTDELANYNACETYADESPGEYRRTITSVGRFPPNAFGLYDMHGNVWEWCVDTWHENYKGAPTNGSPWLQDTNSRSPQKVDSDSSSTRTSGFFFSAFNNKSLQKPDFGSNSTRIPSSFFEMSKTYYLLRGGSWLNTPDHCRSAYRSSSIVRRIGIDYIFGFRVVCGASKTQPINKDDNDNRLKTFTFGTATVNRRGEIIKRETHSAQYLTQKLALPAFSAQYLNYELALPSFLARKELNVITLQLVAIPGGKFMMGSSQGKGYANEKPQHEVSVKPFLMGKYPITQAEWFAIASRPDLQVDRDLNAAPSRFKGDILPVERVSWYDAVEFCTRLSKLTGHKYRLPSEAEWEYACRAGTMTPFYFGETPTSELANYKASKTYADEPQGKYRKQTTQVGRFPPNAFGLYDMHGNVWEWCADTWHKNYQGAPTDGSAWVTGGYENRSPLRGGSWLFSPDFCRSAYRNRNIFWRGYIHNDIGFRVVREL